MIAEDIDYRTSKPPLGARAIDCPPARPRLNWRNVLFALAFYLVLFGGIAGAAWVVWQFVRKTF